MNPPLHLTAAALPVILVPPAPAAAAGERSRSAAEERFYSTEAIGKDNSGD